LYLLDIETGDRQQNISYKSTLNGISCQSGDNSHTTTNYSIY